MGIIPTALISAILSWVIMAFFGISGEEVFFSLMLVLCVIISVIFDKDEPEELEEEKL